MLRIVTLVLYLVDLLSALIVRLTRRGHTYDIYIIVVSYIRPLGSRLFFLSKALPLMPIVLHSQNCLT